MRLTKEEQGFDNEMLVYLALVECNKLLIFSNKYNPEVINPVVNKIQEIRAINYLRRNK